MNSLAITKLITSYPMSRSNNLKHLLRCKILRLEDILGIEQLIDAYGGANMVREHQTHMLRVLKKQEELRKANIVHDMILAEVSIASSAKHSLKARFRAALAA